MSKTRTSLVLAAILMLGLAGSPAFAQDSGPNRINNATVPPDMQKGGTGVYDRYDSYLNPQGFPLSGWSDLHGAS